MELAKGDPESSFPNPKTGMKTGKPESVPVGLAVPIVEAKRKWNMPLDVSSNSHVEFKGSCAPVNPVTVTFEPAPHGVCPKTPVFHEITPTPLLELPVIEPERVIFGMEVVSVLVALPSRVSVTIPVAEQTMSSRCQTPAMGARLVTSVVP